MGLIILYTGTGAGKTTSALGLALRCIGHGLKVIIIQFMKGRKDIGEYLIKERLSPEYEIYQFGRTEWVNLSNPSDEDRELALRGLAFAEKIMLEKKPFLLILDEVNLAVAVNLIPISRIMDFLSKIPEETHVVLTGRYAPSELINRADIVNLVVEAKYPKELFAIKGISY